MTSADLSKLARQIASVLAPSIASSVVQGVRSQAGSLSSLIGGHLQRLQQAGGGLAGKVKGLGAGAAAAAQGAAGKALGGIPSPGVFAQAMGQGLAKGLVATGNFYIGIGHGIARGFGGAMGLARGFGSVATWQANNPAIQGAQAARKQAHRVKLAWSTRTANRHANQAANRVHRFGAALGLNPRAVAFGKRVAGGIGRAAGAAKSMGASAGLVRLLGVAGSAAGAVAALTYAATQALPMMRSFATHINDANRGLASYNGTLAAAFAELHVNRMMRRIGQADATASSGAALARAVDKMESRFVNLDALSGNAKNAMGQFAAGAAGKLAESMDGIAALLNRGLSWMSDHGVFEKIGEMLVQLLTVVGPMNDAIKGIYKWMTGHDLVAPAAAAPAPFAAFADMFGSPVFGPLRPARPV